MLSVPILQHIPMKTSSLLVAFPPTRINDKFGNNNSAIDFSFNVFERDTMIKGEPNDLSTRWFADFYEKIGVDIICETAFDYPYTFITEKTYRAFACLRPFIICGPYKTLDFIRSLEFKTFSAVIDESYDQIQDPTERFLGVCNSIKQFVDRPIEQIKADIVSIESTLLHNPSVLSRLAVQELDKFKTKI